MTPAIKERVLIVIPYLERFVCAGIGVCAWNHYYPQFWYFAGLDFVLSFVKAKLNS
jgi:hypothetical protein